MSLLVMLALVTDFGPNPGALDLYTYVPANLPAGRPIVVVLHGCTQDAAAMEAAGWNALADAHGFTVLYPQQRTANQPLGCFDWYDDVEQGRDAAEARSIVAMVDHSVAGGGDPARVFVTGLSAGAAYTAVLLATYPDRFAAGSIMSGLPYRCAHDLASASSCQQMPGAKDWGALVRAAHAGPWPRVQIWQGDADYTVAPANAAALVAQWTDVHGAMLDATDTIGAATRTRYGGGAVEEFVVSGMGHAIAIGGDGCPAHAGAYFEDHGICSTTLAAGFFGVAGSDPGAGGGSGSGSDPGSGSAAPEPESLVGCSAGGGSGLAPIVALLALCCWRRPTGALARPNGAR